MAGNTRKTELTARLDTLRARFSQDLREVRRDLDVPAQLKRSYARHRTAWLGGAAITGWVLARLPARKKKVKIYVDRKDDRKLKETARAGVLFGIAKLLFSTVRPAVTAFAAKKITDLVARGGTTHRANKIGQR